jgi:predicted nucleic acid-binding protein
MWMRTQDDFAGALANQTNLAIKGIVGIGAMAKIEALLGNTAQSSNYSVRLNLCVGFLLRCA